MPVPGKAVIHRRVPLARRNLLAEPRRLAASALGVGMAIMLILLLDGLWAGIQANITTYEDNVGADLYVAQPGTRNFFGAVSVIPADTVDAVRADPDVDWAAGVRGFFSIVELHDTKVATYVIGSTPGDRGGPWELRQGRAPSADDEVAIGSVMARRHGIDVGDPLEIMGRSFTVVGTTTDAFMASFVFMTHAATDRLLSSPGTTSFVLAGTDDRLFVADDPFEGTRGTVAEEFIKPVAETWTAAEEAVIIPDPKTWRLPKFSMSTSYLLAKEDFFFVYPSNFNEYQRKFANTFQHGGISMAEMVLPVVTLRPK